jgi:TPP-dependent trihydroxycyclohexane-1,2-dione (THcHDO) dehydratase
MHMRGPFAAKFGDFDYAAMARSMGCEGIRVEEPADLVPAIRTALGSRRPTVIDVITSLDSSFTEVLSPLGEGLGFPKTQKAKELNEDLERFKAQDARLQTRP